MKRILLITFATILLFTLCSCKPQAQADVPEPTVTPEPTAEPEPTATPEPTAEPEPTPIPIPTVPAEAAPIAYNADAFELKEDGSYLFKDLDYYAPNIINESYAEENIDHKITNIPTYTPDLITKGYARAITPGADHGMYLYRNVFNCYIQFILTLYPSNAWRQMDENRYYVMYDITDGSRLYLFFPSTDNYALLMGYPVYMQKVLSHEDMQSIKVGDDISTVEAIDPVAKYTKDCWNSYTQEGIDYYNDQGNIISSIHLLSDGIMKISYDLTGEQGSYTFTVSDIEYHEDFKLEGLGGVTDYSIAEVDYVG